MPNNLAWFEARDLARSGKAIRREAWRVWMVRGVALWFSAETVDGVTSLFVMEQGSFGSADFLATDWTDTAWDGGGPPPTGVAALWPIHGGARNFGTIANPPGAHSVFQPAGAGGSESPRPTYTHTPPGGQVPVLTAQVLPFSATNTPVAIRVRLSIMGGPPGVGTFSVQVNEETAQTGVAWPGFDEEFEFPGIVVEPGGTVHVTASYTNGVDTYTAVGSLDAAAEPEAGAGLEQLTPSELVGVSLLG